MVNRVLMRKLVREVSRARSNHLALALIVGLGIAFFSVATALYQNLERSYSASCEQYAMEDFGIQLRSAPSSVVERVRRMEGVQAVEGRLVEDLVVEVGTQNPKRLSGRLIGIQTERPLSVNRLRLMAGRGLSSASRREVLLESKFAEFHNLGVGDTLRLLWRGETLRFRIVGIVRSPELIYVIPSKEQMLPSEDRFGVMFAPLEVVGELTAQPNTINELKLTVRSQYNPEQVARIVYQALRVYGAEKPVMLEDQPSHTFLVQSLEELKTYATLFPIMFLGTSMLVLYTLLTRWVNLQRHLIGLMRALGYSSRQVLFHYWGLALVPAFLGALVGTGITLWSGSWLTRLYFSFLTFPSEVQITPWQTIALGVMLGVVTCLVAGFQPAWQASRIPPAVALRPPAPTWTRVLPIDQWLLGWWDAPLFQRLPFRNLMRTPRRTLTGILGIACGVMLAMLARGILDSQDVAVNRYIQQVIQEDLRFGFLRPQSASIVERVRQWDGVLWAEGVLEIPIKLRKDSTEYETVLRGVEPRSPLLNLTDAEGRPVPISEYGLVCGQVIEKKFGVEPGDMLWVEIPAKESDEPSRARPLRVSGLVWETLGGSVYLPRERVRTLFHRELELPPNAINGLRLMVHPSYRNEVIHRLKRLPDTGVVVVREDVFARLEVLRELGRRFILVMMSFGFVLASAVVFSVVTVGVIERRSEVATLLTIGFSQQQVIRLLFIESMLVVLAGIGVGLPLGRVMVSLFIQMASTPEQMELFAFRTYVFPTTYLLSALGVLGVSLVSLIPALRSAIQVDLVSALKERSI
ncbi:MAG: FtsX-like permease family protein [Fimbriimonadales bacterium]